MAATKTLTKTAAKSAPKAAPKSKAAPKTEAKSLFYATLLTEALAGKFGPLIQGYYKRAAEYHQKRGTTFPRGKWAAEPLLKPEDAVAFLTKRTATSIPSGDKTGQRLYDQMRVEASQI